MGRKKVLVIGCAALLSASGLVGGLSYLGRSPYSFLDSHHPTPLVAPSFAIPRYEYMKDPPRLMIFSPEEAPKVLDEMRQELKEQRGYRMTDEIAAMDRGLPAAPEDDDFHPVLWGFAKDGDVAEYMNADLALFGFGFQGVPTPKELKPGGCVVMIHHEPKGVEAAWLKARQWLHLK